MSVGNAASHAETEALSVFIRNLVQVSGLWLDFLRHWLLFHCRSKAVMALSQLAGMSGLCPAFLQNARTVMFFLSGTASDLSARKTLCRLSLGRVVIADRMNDMLSTV
jgi:hypothetical protein